MRYLTLLLALAFTASAQTYIFGGGKAAAIVGPQATTLPASCATEGLLLRLTADDGANKRGLYYCVSGTYTRSGFTGTEGRLLRFGAANAVGLTTGIYEDGSGNVGIGTTGPGARLEVNTGADAVKGLIVKGNGGTQSGNLAEFWYSGAYTARFDQYGGFESVGNSNNSFGGTVVSNVVLAALSPSAGAGSTTPLMARGHTSQSVDIFQVRNSSNGILFNVNNTGNVGIGTTEPAMQLTLSGAAGTRKIIGLYDTANGFRAAFGTAASTNDLLTGSSSDDLAITTIQKILFGVINQTATMIIANGNVGIGITTPAAKLDVVGTLKLAGTEATCEAATRGQMARVEGGAGVADTLRWCAKAAAGTYSWVAVDTAP